MIFNSFEFAIFLPLVLVAYYCLSTRYQNWLLLGASAFFYGWWDYRFLCLLCFSTVMDYSFALSIDRASTIGRRKLWIWASVVCNLTVLGFFKYFNFFYDSTVEALQWMGFEANPSTLKIVLPVGISFYTFQSMSYTIDVYRRHLKPCTNLATFALYVTYFPQLVAGPIERATSLLPQLNAKRNVSTDLVAQGLFLIIFGLFKKVGIADTVAPLVDARFTDPGSFRGADLLFGVYLFALQIYGDFSGYSDIARGTSKLLGIDLMVNFLQPYFSASIIEFWRRWHISLSTWLRDYLYIPLGGNRFGPWLTYRNLLLTMLIGGAWHGANWTFILWGGLHGVYLGLSRALGIDQSWTHARPFRRIVFTLITFHLVCLAWIFFRADSIQLAIQYLERVLDLNSFFQSEQQPWLSGRILVLIFGLMILDAGQAAYGDEFFLFRFPAPVRGLAYGLIIALTIALGGLDAEVPFIYFQF